MDSAKLKDMEVKRKRNAEKCDLLKDTDLGDLQRKMKLFKKQEEFTTGDNNGISTMNYFNENS